jgi:hypothetical protein
MPDRPNSGPLVRRVPPQRHAGDGTERRVQVIDIPAGADDELAAMASLVATLEALDPRTGARSRVLRWALGRYDPPARPTMATSVPRLS